MLSLVLLSLVLMAFGRPAEAQDPGANESSEAKSAAIARPVEGPGRLSVRERQELDRAVGKALDYLATQHSRVAGEYRGFQRTEYPVATTSLAGLAMLAAGVLPDEGKHSDQLIGCLNFLLDLGSRTDFLTEPGAGVGSGSRMHGHCYAILFLTQAVGSLTAEREKEVSRVIRKGIKVIARSQSRYGGWFYGADNEADQDEASVTICAIQALRAARDAGFSVDATIISRAINYVKKCQNSDGSVRYMMRGNGQKSTYALTAAAVSTLNAAGVYRSKELTRGLDFMRRELRRFPNNPLKAVVDSYFYYGNLYVGQALWQHGGHEWDTWYGRARVKLLRRQKKTGEWVSRPFGDAYATSMAILILGMPVGYLPIFER